ncbi:MAG: NAD(P)/FAD-dependent oxidoreductase [Candidatus Aenigmatarchaeota archaeon]
MYDVIIVGAGPVGLYTANILEKKLKALVLEKSREIGKKACSGLYSSNLDSIIKFKKTWVEHEVNGAVLHSPLGTDIMVKKDKTAALVVDRELFTKGLAERVKSRIITDCSVKSIDIGSHVTCHTSKGDFEAKIIIGCDGANSVVRKHFGEEPEEIVNGLIAVVDKKDQGDSVELWFDSKKLPDGFFWKIPRGKTTEYGMLGHKATYKQLVSFFKIKKYRRHAASIPMGPCKTYFPRTLLIGDAGGITKPWSGGGVMYGIKCAQIARDVIFKSFKMHDMSEKVLKEYEDRWKEDIGKHIATGMLFRKIFKNLDNKSLDILFKKMKKKNLNKLDMDFPVFG